MLQQFECWNVLEAAEKCAQWLISGMKVKVFHGQDEFENFWGQKKLLSKFR